MKQADQSCRHSGTIFSFSHCTPYTVPAALARTRSDGTHTHNTFTRTGPQGHMEFFICNTDELPQGADSVPTQECFNKIPLDRDPNYGNFSPIDPSYYGRYHLDPECTADETNIEVMNDWRGWIARMHYLIPEDLECEHCVLQAVYRERYDLSFCA